MQHPASVWNTEQSIDPRFCRLIHTNTCCLCGWKTTPCVVLHLTNGTPLHRHSEWTLHFTPRTKAVGQKTTWSGLRFGPVDTPSRVRGTGGRPKSPLKWYRQPKPDGPDGLGISNKQSFPIFFYFQPSFSVPLTSPQLLQGSGGPSCGV